MPDEYISRAEALRAVQKQRGANRSPAQNAMLDRICCDIKNRPAADVAQVVQCRYCKYGDYDSKSNGAMVCLRTNDGFWRKETDFCSYGERRTDSGGDGNVVD